MATVDAFASFCPRCDKKYTGPTQIIANGLVRGHLVANDPQDDLHVGALEAWDDEASK